MRLLWWIFVLVTGFYLFNRYKYRLLNVILAVDVIRKMAVSLSMQLPYIREKILPKILGRTSF
ncbi:hypothetical protein GLW08_09250 [Pontibacillus yanchengensis]|uniref:Uncharacterized protein n=2 Tax=Pontibacillus yanchengensis TaxID=462910 RepID=A0ACC7VFZ2_9BACI|nr:hypothetical protein [Pontibacillus yanchengensis]MYL33470.1 hypothetical protein [Pontibacillus yanchengensis]MYL53520.1 hypothetical protein [Pontibacillus yanchengensis]